MPSLGELIRKMNSLDPSVILGDYKPTMQSCIVCKRMCPITGLYTGEANQRMCEKCKKDYHHLAKILCKGCGRFLGFMQTGINQDGYRVKPDETLHVEYCEYCDKGRARKEKTSPIIEIQRFKQIKLGNEMAGVIESGAHRGELG